MQIHELNDYNGNLDSGAYLGVDNGTDTGKLSVERLLADTNNEIDVLETQLNARIDNIIAGGTAPSEAEIVDARLGVNGGVYPSLGDAIRGQIETVQSEFEDVFETKYPINLLDFSAVTFGYYMTDAGVIGANASYWYTDYIPVQEGHTYTRQRGQLTVTQGRNIATTRWISCYDAAKTLLPGLGTSSSPSSFTIPEGVSYIRMSGSTYMEEADHPTVVEGTALLDYSEYFAPYSVLKESANNEPLINNLIGDTRTTGIVHYFDIDSDNHSFEDVQDVNNYTVEFKGKITTLNSLIVGHGYQTSNAGYIKITPTTFEYYLGTEANPRLSEAHGLTLKDYINIKIDADFTNVEAKFTITTNGGTYTKTGQAWDSKSGYLCARSEGANTLTECVLSYYARGWRKNIHIYGDSYVGVYQDRWTYHLIQAGYTNYLLNAFPGRVSSAALANLRDVVLPHSRPKEIIWAMGMNDGDVNGVINAAWKACVESLISICEEKGIELILATIPNVPGVDNTAKNAYVKASGYRYIDFASAVSANSGSTWFDNMLSNDNTHPTREGALALFNQAIADVPELMD